MIAPNSFCKVVRDKDGNTVAVFDVDGNVTLEVTCYNGFYDTDNVCWLHFGREGLLELAAILTEAAKMDGAEMSDDELKKVNEARLCAHYWRQKAFAMYSALCQATGQYQELMNEDDIFPWEEPNLEDFKNSGEITTVDWDKVESEKCDADRD